FGEVARIMREHATLLVEWFGPHGIRMFRKHAGWYTKGFPRSAELRGQLMRVQDLAHLDTLLAPIDAETPFPPTAMRVPRGKSGGTQRVALPEGYLLDRDDATPLADEVSESAVHGG
ncbi:MAG: tRNA-dihydrouridine synthase, partial [Myxococcales bacterium]|nr:tRNA-dihydrouridine synthase [Myxococcales bacterium]